MFRKWILLAATVFLFSASVPAYAEEEQLEQHQAAQETKTEVVVNEEAGTVSIVVNGKEVAVFGEDGLRVKGNIEHTGYITATSGRTDPEE